MVPHTEGHSQIAAMEGWPLAACILLQYIDLQYKIQSVNISLFLDK